MSGGRKRGIATLNKVVRAGFDERVAFGQRLEKGDKRMRQVDILGRRALGRGQRQCEGPKAEQS